MEPWTPRSIGETHSALASVQSAGLTGAEAIAHRIASVFDARAFGGDDLPRPATVVMAYTGHSDVASDDPPTYVVVGEKDGIAPPAVMERRIDALRKAGTEVEYRKFRNVGHGFGVGTGTSAQGWIADAIRFWERFGDD